MTPSACKWHPRHLPTVVYTRRPRDRFRRRYWVRCWECSLRVGPFDDPKKADACRSAIDGEGWPLRYIFGTLLTELLPREHRPDGDAR